VGGQRTATLNHKRPERWLEAVNTGGHGSNEQTAVTREQAQTEALLMGLRLTEGISRARWQQQFGADIATYLAADKIKKLTEEDYLRVSDTHITATTGGRQRLQAVLNYLVN
jgi:oxygen-independent coproporphyrinogen-3 oxidase